MRRGTLTPESLAGAKKYFKEAIALDPEFALAHAGYSSHLFFRTHTTHDDAHQVMPLARREARRALELDPPLADAHATLAGEAATYDSDWTEAERHYAQAIASRNLSPCPATRVRFLNLNPTASPAWVASKSSAGCSECWLSGRRQSSRSTSHMYHRSLLRPSGRVTLLSASLFPK